MKLTTAIWETAKEVLEGLLFGVICGAVLSPPVFISIWFGLHPIAILANFVAFAFVCAFVVSVLNKTQGGAE